MSAPHEVKDHESRLVFDEVDAEAASLTSPPDYLPFLQDTYMSCSYLAGVCVSVKCIYNIHQMFCLGNSVNQTASWYGLFDINMLGLCNNSSILSPERKRQNKVTGWDPMVEIRNMEHLIYGFVTVKNTSFLLKSYCHPLLGLGFWQLKGHLASGYAKCHIVTAPLC